MFSSFGSEVTLIVSRQQVLPRKDPEVAAVLEADFQRRGVHLLKGARAIAVKATAAGATVSCDDGRVVEGSHALLAIGSVPNTEGLGLDGRGRRGRPERVHRDQPALPDERSPHLRRR